MLYDGNEGDRKLYRVGYCGCKWRFDKYVICDSGYVRYRDNESHNPQISDSKCNSV